jgi:hypothetical protein
VKRDDDGASVEVVEAGLDQEPSVLGTTLRRLRQREHVSADHIAVLTAVSMSRSRIWSMRRFGGDELANAAVNADGSSKRLPPHRVPPEPSGSVLCETIRRFKGMERKAVLLVELPPEAERLDQLMYEAITRATTHLTVIAPPALMERLRD